MALNQYMTDLYSEFQPDIYPGPEKVYDKYAQGYDNFFFNAQAFPDCFIVGEYIAGNYPQDSKIIDVACGTGVLGQLLHEKGFKDMIGIDCSQEMINLALKKQCYKKIEKKFIQDGSLKEFEGQFSLVTCTGSLALSHIQPVGLIEIFKLGKKNTHVFFTIKVAHFNDGYSQVLSQKEKDGMIKQIHCQKYQKFQTEEAKSLDFLQQEAEAYFFVYEIIL